MEKDYTEICSDRTIFSEQQGFFGEMFEVVKNCCTNKWLKTKFEALPTDGEKFRLIFDEPNVSDMVLGTLEHVIPVFRKKDCSFSYQRRKQGERLHEQNDLNNALMLLTHAILRAPAKGKKDYIWGNDQKFKSTRLECQTACEEKFKMKCSIFFKRSWHPTWCWFNACISIVVAICCFTWPTSRKWCINRHSECNR